MTPAPPLHPQQRMVSFDNCLRCPERSSRRKCCHESVRGKSIPVEVLKGEYIGPDFPDWCPLPFASHSSATSAEQVLTWLIDWLNNEIKTQADQPVKLRDVDERGAILTEVLSRICNLSDRAKLRQQAGEQE